MGNAGKAIYSREEYLYYYISQKKYNKITEILEKHPQLLEKPLTKDTKHTILMRAVYLGDLTSVDYVLEKNPDVNSKTPKGETALTLAVKKNKIAIAQRLIQKGAEVDYEQKGLSVLDYAVLPGYYEMASLIYSKSKKKQFKQPTEYEDIAKKHSYRYVNYNKLVAAIRSMDQRQAQNEGYLEKEKVTLNDPVPDPRESWKQWLRRNLQFKDAPMVQRDSLPEELRPQNRGFKGKADIALTNWVRRQGRKASTIKPRKGRQVMSQMGELCSKKLVGQQYASAG